MPIRLTLLLPLLFVFTACSTPPPVPNDLPAGDLRYLAQYFDWYFPRALAKHNVPGVSVALVDGDRVLWSKGYGFADQEREVPATPQTVYQVGSITKLLTATAVMQLVERGGLNLDAPVNSYLPEFSIQSRWDKTPQLTLRQMLSHHAGLPTYYLKGFFSRQPLTELVSSLQHEHLAYPPEKIFNYSNLGPDIAGRVLEQMSTRSYEEYMQTTLLAQLGMRHSSFEIDRVRPNLARGYIKRAAADTMTIRDVPAGGLYSNVEDLARFMRCILGEGTIDGQQVLKRETLQAMLTPQYPELALNFGQRFGLGWFLSGLPLEGVGTVAWHNGGTKAFLSQMIVLPEKRLGVVVIANADSGGTMVYEAAEEVLRMALQAREGRLTPPASTPPPEVTIASALLDNYAGDYSLMGALAHVERDGQRLQFKVLGHTLELVPLSETRFRARYRLLGLIPITIPFPPIEFVRNEGRTFFLMRDRGIAITAEKVPEYTVSEAWRQRAGDYRLINPDSEYLVNVEQTKLVVENDKIYMLVRIAGIEDRTIKVVLMPLNDDMAYTFGIGRNVGDITVAERHGNTERMRYLGYVFERVVPTELQLQAAAEVSR